MIINTPGFAGTRSRPLQAIAPYEKDEEWCRKNAEYIYSYHFNSWLYQQQSQYGTLRDYANGTQSIEKYKNLLAAPTTKKNSQTKIPSSFVDTELSDGSQCQTANTADYTNIDFSNVLSPAPKLMDKVISMLEDPEYRIEVSAVDKSSLRDKKNKKTRMKVFMKEKEFLNQVNAEMGTEVIKFPENLPEDEDELLAVERLGMLDLEYEKGLRKGIKWTEEMSDKKEMARSLKRDMLEIGVAAAFKKYDKVRNITIWEHLDPENLILEYSKGSKKENSSFGGYMKYYSIVDLRILMPELTEKKIYEIAGYWSDNSGLGNGVAKNQLDLPSVYLNTGTCNYNDIKIPVLYTEWKSVDVIYNNSNTSEDNSHRVYGKIRKSEIERGKIKKDDKGYYKPHFKTEEGGEVELKKLGELCVNYQCEWVVGTDVVLPCWGKKYNNSYDYTSKESPLSIYAYFVKGKSFIERAIPMLDNFAIAGYKFTNDIATAFPTNTVVYEINSIQKAITKMGDETVKPYDLIKIGRQDGILTWAYEANMLPSATNQGGGIARPIELLRDAGISKAINELDLAMNSFNTHIANLIGIDMYTSVSKAPGNEHTVGGMQMQQSASYDTIKIMQLGWIAIYEGLAKDTAMNIQVIAAASKKNKELRSGYKDIMTEGEWEALQEAGTPTADRPLPAYYNIMIKVAIDNETKMALAKTAAEATQGGKNGIPALTYSEYLFLLKAINDGADLGDIRAYIAEKENIRSKKEEERAMRAEQANTERALGVEEMKMQNQAKIITLEKNLELRNAAKIEELKALGQMAVNEKKTEDEINKTMQLDPDIQNEIKASMGFTLGGGQQGATGQQNGTEQPMV